MTTIIKTIKEQSLIFCSFGLKQSNVDKKNILGCVKKLFFVPDLCYFGLKKHENWVHEHRQKNLFVDVSLKFQVLKLFLGLTWRQINNWSMHEAETGTARRKISDEQRKSLLYWFPQGYRNQTNFVFKIRTWMIIIAWMLSHFAAFLAIKFYFSKDEMNRWMLWNLNFNSSYRFYLKVELVICKTIADWSRN